MDSFHVPLAACCSEPAPPPVPLSVWSSGSGVSFFFGLRFMLFLMAIMGWWAWEAVLRRLLTAQLTKVSTPSAAAEPRWKLSVE